MASEVNPDGTVRSDRQLGLAIQGGNLQQPDDIRASVSGRMDDEGLIDLREYWNILIRRRAIIATVLAVAVGVALLATFLSTPMFRAETLIQIEREGGKVLEFQDLMTQESVNAKDFYQTQYELLRSRNLASRVIDQHGLRSVGTVSESNAPSFFVEAISMLKDWIQGDNSSAEETVEGDVESLFLESLNITPVKNSSLVRVSYDSPDPKEAADIANAIAESFIRMNLERRYEASSYAKTFLKEQTQQVQANLEDSERRLAAYAREREIINLDDKLEILVEKLKKMSTELIRAESERILAEAKYQEMLEEGLASTDAVLASHVVQSFKARKADLDIEYQELIKIYKPSYPRMQQIREQIAKVEQKIADESAIIANSIKASFESHTRREAKLKRRIGEIKEEILTLQDRSTDYQAIKREVDTNRELYDGLLQRMKEVGVAAGIGTNNISVVDSAEIPGGPYKPSLWKNLAIAFVLGLFGGVLLAFLSESLDDTMRSSEQLERQTGIPVLGLIPFVSDANVDSRAQSISLLTYQNPKSALGEAIRSMRTSLIFATPEGDALRVLHFTSSNPGEGKTSTAVNTAITFTQTGSKVLLIDADLRNPSLHKVFSLPNTQGLTNYLTSNVEPAQIAQATEVIRLFAITSGPISPNPVELLSSDKMLDLVQLARKKFDYVIIDGSPVIGLADALVLANLAGASLVVVEGGKTRVGALDASIKRLSGVNARIVGCVLTKVRRSTSNGYEYDYRYSYGAANEQTALPKQSVS